LPEYRLEDQPGKVDRNNLDSEPSELGAVRQPFWITVPLELLDNQIHDSTEETSARR
jgi:hypothetical protein